MEYNMYENRNYVIFSVTELDKINFDEVLETSAETVRRSVDGTKTFVKWEDSGSVPLSVLTLTTNEPYLTHAQMLELMATPEWTAPQELV
jgi:UDP-3-O-[3-hydroxymyristoyl] glucosamine N-acyltransferase